jgi:hypothetical protein
MNHEDFDPRVGADADAQLLVKFEVRAKLDRTASDEEGRPIYRDTEYINIRAPGSPDNVVRPATDRDRDRFPKHYAAFKNRTDQEQLDGTPLSEWPAINRSQVEELAFLGVKTVEQLSAISDANAQQIMGFQMLKKKATDWLEAAAMGVSAGALKAELDKRDEQIAKLQAQVEELSKPKPRKKKVTAKKKE